MTKIKYLLILLFALACGFTGYKITHSYFTDTEKVLGNSIQVGTWGITPSPETPTPTNTLTPTLTLTPTPSNLADHIVISEVQIYGSNANQDFVELYNPTSYTVDLSGWRLRKRNSSGNEDSLAVIPDGKSIPAHGFFLWANNQGNFDTSIGADISNGNNLSENNSVAIFTKSGNTPIDQVAWGSANGQFVEGTACQLNFSSGGSIERKAYSTSDATSMMSGSDVTKGNAYDSENNSEDFILRTISNPQNTSSPIEIP